MITKSLDIPDAIDEIYDRLEIHFKGDDIHIRGWLHTPNDSLPGEMTPNEMLRARRVLELLEYVRGMTEVVPPVDVACPS